MNKNVDHPSHYNHGTIEVIKAMLLNTLPEVNIKVTK